MASGRFDAHLEQGGAGQMRTDVPSTGAVMKPAQLGQIQRRHWQHSVQHANKPNNDNCMLRQAAAPQIGQWSMGDLIMASLRW